MRFAVLLGALVLALAAPASAVRLPARGTAVVTFKGKRAATVRPVLDALAGLGMARRLNDGRYAA